MRSKQGSWAVGVALSGLLAFGAQASAAMIDSFEGGNDFFALSGGTQGDTLSPATGTGYGVDRVSELSASNTGYALSWYTSNDGAGNAGVVTYSDAGLASQSFTYDFGTGANLTSGFQSGLKVDYVAYLSGGGATIRIEVETTAGTATLEQAAASGFNSSKLFSFNSFGLAGGAAAFESVQSITLSVLDTQSIMLTGFGTYTIGAVSVTQIDYDLELNDGLDSTAEMAQIKADQDPGNNPAVPEPGILTLVALGGAASAFARRRRG